MGQVSDNYWNNGAYYGHVVAYSVNDNGSYNLNWLTDGKGQGRTVHGNLTNPIDVNGAWITKGAATIDWQTNKFPATDNTIFMLADEPGEPGTSYTVYVGKKNVPSIENAKLCILTDTKSYVTRTVDVYEKKWTRKKS